MLLESNIVIYAAKPEHKALRQFIREREPLVSVITQIEVLGFHRFEFNEREDLEAFFSRTEIIPLTDDIVEQAIQIRQQRRMGLGDSIIAATSLVLGLALVTHNTEDFRWIEDLKLLDPMF